MSRLTSALLVVVALIAFDGIDAAASENDANLDPPSEIRFTGAVVVPAGSHAVADAQSVASLPSGQTIRRGSTDPARHDPPRAVVVLPPRKGDARVVVITYE